MVKLGTFPSVRRFWCRELSSWQQCRFCLRPGYKRTVEGMSGTGSWLQPSSKRLLHGTKGNARVVVRNGNHQASLDAPYEVVGIGKEGGAIKLRTSCGPMSFLFTAATNGKPGFSLDASDVYMLERKAGVSRCGLGDRINLVGTWWPWKPPSSSAP